MFSFMQHRLSRFHGDPNEFFDFTGIFAESTWGDADPTGDAGTITIDAPSVTIDTLGRVSSNTIGPGQGGGVTVNADTVTLAEGASIRSETGGGGNGGNIIINATQALEIYSHVYVTGIFADSNGFLAFDQPGAAGNITINAPSVMVVGGQVSSNTSGSGNGGNITVNADNVTLTGIGISASTWGAATAATFSSTRPARLWSPMPALCECLRHGRHHR